MFIIKKPNFKSYQNFKETRAFTVVNVFPIIFIYFLIELPNILPNFFIDLLKNQ